MFKIGGDKTDELLFRANYDGKDHYMSDRSKLKLTEHGEEWIYSFVFSTASTSCTRPSGKRRFAAKSQERTAEVFCIE